MSTSAAAAPTPSSSLSSSSAPVVVHFLSDSRAESILWLLEELGVDYRIHYWRREPNMLAPKGLRQIHPLGKSPVLEHAGQTIAETGNIIEYLLSRAFQSETTAAFRQYPTAEGKETDSYFMFYVEGSLMPILVNKLVFSKFPAMSPWYIRPIISSFASSVDKMWLDKQLVTHLAMVRPRRSLSRSDLHSVADLNGPSFRPPDRRRLEEVAERLGRRRIYPDRRRLCPLLPAQQALDRPGRRRPLPRVDQGLGRARQGPAGVRGGVCKARRGRESVRRWPPHPGRRGSLNDGQALRTDWRRQAAAFRYLFLQHGRQQLLCCPSTRSELSSLARLPTLYLLALATPLLGKQAMRLSGAPSCAVDCSMSQTTMLFNDLRRGPRMRLVMGWTTPACQLSGQQRVLPAPHSSFSAQHALCRRREGASAIATASHSAHNMIRLRSRRLPTE